MKAHNPTIKNDNTAIKVSAITAKRPVEKPHNFPTACSEGKIARLAKANSPSQADMINSSWTSLGFNEDCLKLGKIQVFYQEKARLKSC